MKLREARRAAGLSQADLARLVGVQQNTISAYERGRARPSPDVLAALVRVLGVGSAEALGYRWRPAVLVGDVEEGGR